MTQDELLVMLKALEDRKLLGVEAFDDEFDVQDLDELKSMLVNAGPKCRACLACAGKTSRGVPFQAILNRYKVFVDPSIDGLELRNGDGSLAAKVKP